MNFEECISNFEIIPIGIFDKQIHHLIQTQVIIKKQITLLHSVHNYARTF